MTIDNDKFGFRFRDWDIYKDARKFRIEINELLKNYPKEEKYALTDQTKIALNSILLNIAESANKNTDKDMRVYINRAHCSLDEVVACLDCALDDKYITEEQHKIALEKASSLAKRFKGFTNRLTVDIQSVVKSQQSTVKSQKSTVNGQKGQSLVEVLIAISVAAILIGGSAVAIVAFLKSNLETRSVQIATSLAQEYLDNLQNLAEANWQNIYSPPASKGSSSQFYLAPTSTTFMIVAGTTSTVVEGKTFTRYFSIENVNRDSCGIGNITTEATTTCVSGPGSTGVADDPSTQKITVTVSWQSAGTTPSISRTQYFTRTRNFSFIQTDWSGGPGQEGPITSINNQFATSNNINYASSTGSIKIQGF